MINVGPIAAYILATTLTVNDAPVDFELEDYVCMSEVIHMEAQGESQEGKKAVANVVLNRVESNRYPDTVCGVVHQKYQFSYRNKVKYPLVSMKNDLDSESFTETAQIAYDAIEGNFTDNTNGATHYLNPKKLKKLPKWFRMAKDKLEIDEHVFVKL